MVPVGFYSREELLKRLAPYKVSFVGEISLYGAELWELGWGRAFTMRREPDGRYDEAQYRAALDRRNHPL